MTLAQENFERAVSSGYGSLKMLADAVGDLRAPMPQLREVNTRKLREIAWDLEAIQAAIRLEINGRPEAGGMDLG